MENLNILSEFREVTDEERKLDSGLLPARLSSRSERRPLISQPRNFRAEKEMLNLNISSEFREVTAEERNRTSERKPSCSSCEQRLTARPNSASCPTPAFSAVREEIEVPFRLLSLSSI